MKLGDRALAGVARFAVEPQLADVLDGRYELRQPIGEGGMGVVYAARDRASGREVAVKIVRPATEHDAIRFEREVRTLEQVSHPAVVRHLAHGCHEGIRYLVMERLEGCTLADRLHRARLSIADTAALGARIASALAAIHELGIVHRDVKPSNVFLVGDDGSRVADARLLDFGLARRETTTILTAPRSMVGTPGYIAPERVRGDDDAAKAPGDVFSLGCVLYECVLGRPPFEAETTAALLTRVLIELTPRIRNERSETPPELETLIEQMLSKTPSERPSATVVARALEALAAQHRSPAAFERRQLAEGLFEGDMVGAKYCLERRLGEGGMGVVLAARHRELGTTVALKMLRAATSDEARLLREARAASRIDSEHIAKVLDVGRADDGRPFIVMEYLDGEDLAARLAARGTLSADEAVRYAVDTCTALAAAHALGIVHRDVKPSNVFLARRRDGTEIVKVLDFGISKTTGPADEHSVTATAESVVMGSIAYMAPEQIVSTTKADARSDVWSLGIVLFELVSGARPFVGDTAVAIAARIAAAAPRPLRAVAPQAPAELEAIIARCLAKDPAGRFEDAGALRGALVSLGSAPPRRAPPWRSRGALVIAAVLASAGLGLSLRATPFVASSPPAPASAPRVATLVPPDAPAPSKASETVAASSTPTPLQTGARPRTTPSPRSAPRASAIAPATSTPRDRLDLRGPAFEER